MQVCQRDVDVVDLRRPFRFGGEPVLARQGGVPEPAEQDPVPAQLGAIALDPPATVHEEHPAAIRCGWAVQVREQHPLAGSPDLDRLDRYAFLQHHGSQRGRCRMRASTEPGH